MSDDPIGSVASARKLPPHDSWISLEPGKTLTLNVRTTEEWTQKTREYRELRGHVLSLCFSIEFGLDRLVCEIFFPGVDTKGAAAYNNEDVRSRRDLLDELFLKGNRTSFASKIQLLRALRVKQLWLAEFISIELLGRLDALRDIRNRFAHYPVSFFPEEIGDSQALIAKLVCRDKDVRLDDAFFQHFDTRFGSLEVDLQQILTVVCQRQIQIPFACDST